jgi:hypothetical protein
MTTKLSTGRPSQPEHFPPLTSRATLPHTVGKSTAARYWQVAPIARTGRRAQGIRPIRSADLRAGAALLTGALSLAALCARLRVGFVEQVARRFVRSVSVLHEPWRSHRFRMIEMTFMGTPEPPDTWAETANAASFSFFELADPRPQHRWAGGYGVGEEPLQLEILHLVDGSEVSVVTDDAGLELPPDHHVRMLVLDLVTHAILNGSEPLGLPATFAIERDERSIVVDGTPVVFDGAKLADRWSGRARIGEVFVSVRCRGPVAVAALSTCKNWAMPDRPPVQWRG